MYCKIISHEDRPEYKIEDNLTEEVHNHMIAARALFLKMDTDESGELDEEEISTLIRTTYKKTGNEDHDEEEI